MLQLLKLAGLCLGLPFLAFVYLLLFGPVLAVAFASTAALAGLAAAAGLERIGYGAAKDRSQRAILFFALLLLLGALFEPSDSCVDRGGVWNWHSVECRHDGAAS